VSGSGAEEAEEGMTEKGQIDIEEVRRELQEQMAQKGTEKLAVRSGDGWTAHVREKHDSLAT
jgi:hypothetical protein